MTQQLDPKGSARRKLVRGTFAAPALLALHSGGALAASSNLRCISVRNANPVSPVPAVTSSPTADTYLRYQLWSIQNNGNSTIAGYFVRGADLAPLARAGQAPYLPSSQAQLFDVSTNTGSATFTTDPPSMTGNQSVVRSEKFAVLRIDANGRIVGIGSGGTGSAVSGSCWTSFAAGAPA